MSFTLRRDTGNVPVAGYQDSADVVEVLLYLPVRIVDEVDLTDANGFFWTNYKPILDFDRDSDRAINENDIAAKMADDSPLYIGAVDARAGKIELFSDLSKTEKYTSQQAKVTYTTLVPCKSTLDGQITAYLEQLPGSLTASGNLKVSVQESLPTGSNLIGKVDINGPLSVNGSVKVAANTVVAPILSSEVLTSSGDSFSTPVSVAEFRQLIVFLNVSQVSSNNAVLSCQIETLDPISNQWVPIAAFDPVSAVGSQQRTLCAGFANSIGISWTVTGESPSFTVDVGVVLRS